MLDYLIWNGLLGLLIEFVIVARGISKGLFRRYLSFYLYICYVASISLFRGSVLFTWGYQSDAYYYFYHWTNLLFPLFQIWVLWDLFRKFATSKNTGKAALKLTIFCTVISIPVAFGLLNSRVALFHKVQTLALPFQAAFCLTACHAIARNRAVILGKNERGILLGLAMLLALQSLNFAYYAFELRQASTYTFLTQFVYVVTLIILVWHLWDYHPSRFREAVVAERVAKLDSGFQGLVRGLLFRK